VVGPGQTVNLNITVVKLRVTRVSGRAVNQTGAASRGGLVYLTPSGLAEVWGAMANLGPQGEFESTGVAPGAYSLQIRLGLKDGRWRNVQQAITVGQEPVENLNVIIPGAYEIPGTLRVEGNVTLDVRTLKVRLRTPWRDIYGFAVEPATAGDDGAFRLSEVNPERYVLDVQNLPEAFYIKTARFGDVDALAEGVDLTRGGPAPLEVVLSGAAAAVAGSVKNGDGGAVAEATVALVPQEVARQGRPLFYRSAKTDAAGNFKLTGLSPGEYKLFAWTQVDGEPWTSDEFLKPLESRGRVVTLREGSSESVEVRVIPAEQ
jgi:hypothetical protein